MRDRPSTHDTSARPQSAGRPTVPSPALLAAWGTAALQGRTSPDEAVARAGGFAETQLRIRGVPGETDAVGLSLALGRMRAAGATGLRLVLPRPGDPAGLPGPAEFNKVALEAGAAVLATGTAALGLVPDAADGSDAGEATDGVNGRGRAAVSTQCWQTYDVSPARTTDVPSLAEADRALQAALRASVEELVRLDVARWRPEVAAAVAAIRDGAGGEAVLPPGHPPRAHLLLATALRVAAIVELAGGNPGAAVSAGEMARRTAALDPLERASRHAVMAASNAALEPQPTY